MIRSMFSGVAGLRTHQAKMDSIGNNIANVNTNGFKAARTTFQESIYQTVSGSSAGTSVMGGTNPSQVGYGSKVSSIDLLFTTGSYEPTGYGTDCMIDGNGFFLVGDKLPAGKDFIQNYDPTGTETSEVGGLLLTRLGKFSVDGDGYLTTSDGKVVYGFYNEDGLPIMGTGDFTFADGDATTGYVPELKPIRIQGVDDKGVPTADPDAERLNLTGLRIDKGGVLIGSDGKNNYQIAKLAIANVPNPNALEKVGGPYYQAVQNTGSVQAFEAGSGSTGKIEAYGLEMANVDIAKEFSDMITTQRGFQANSKIITVSDEMLQELVNMKR